MAAWQAVGLRARARTYLIYIHQVSRTHVMAMRCSHSEEAVLGIHDEPSCA